MVGKGHNNPPITMELTRDEAELLRDILDRDMGQGLALLEMVQKGQLRKEAAERVVEMMEAIRPINHKFREALK